MNTLHAFRRPGLFELRMRIGPDDAWMSSSPLVCVSIVDIAHNDAVLCFSISPAAGIRLSPDDRAHPNGQWNMWLGNGTVFALSADEVIAIAASGVITPTHALPTAVAA